MANSIETRDKKSLATFLAENPNEQLDIRPYTTKSGKSAYCFVIGKTVGHVSEKLGKEIETVAMEDVEYAEVKTEHGTWMPCLFLANRGTVVRSFKL